MQLFQSQACPKILCISLVKMIICKCIIDGKLLRLSWFIKFSLCICKNTILTLIFKIMARLGINRMDLEKKTESAGNKETLVVDIQL